MSEKIDKTLKKIVNDTKIGKNNSPEDDSETSSILNDVFPGDKDCPYCHGLGFTRVDVPIGHPDFGKIEICVCRQNEVNKAIHERLFELSNLDALQHMTFENFVPRGQVGLWPTQADSLELAFNHAQQFATRLDGWLLMQGGYGCGKTHLAAAIANFAVSLGIPTLFITVPDLLDLLRMAYDSPETTYEKRFDQIRNAQLLIMDDFGTQNATKWAQEKLFQIINYRYTNRLATVITTNTPLEEIEERIRSRLIDPELVTKVKINAPDYRNPAGDLGYQKISLLQESAEMRFDTFDLRENEGLTAQEVNSLKRAYEAAKKFAAQPVGWLIISGPRNSGKTHLALAIANYISQSSSPPQAISVPEMLNYLRATFSPRSTDSLDRRFDEIRSERILILDDLGTQYVTPWVQEQLYLLFDYRYRKKLPTVITTSEFIDEMDNRIVSKMNDPRLCTKVAITAPSFFRKPSKQRKSNSNRRGNNKPW
jgi:DNA replication protein DnaC